ncbi:hypothetical protein FHR61_003868 [Xanthomonas arboricola]|uniref:Uncharacterized protein n=1 Tax=Xanthomonas cannabis TaxID=1885674 RepID=A0ABR6JQS5_9XANT|nr:hypothetical protein [Xanthomonas cannabis]MBB5523978.1 hypothetical protein [Xanthomonas cannabis]
MQRDRLRLERTALLQIACCSCLQRGCRSHHTLQADVAAAGQGDGGGFTAKLATASQTTRVDQQGVLGDQAAAVVDKPGDGCVQRLARHCRTALIDAGGSEAKVVTALHAPRILQCASDQCDAAHASQRTRRRVGDRASLYRKIAACNDLAGVTQHAIGAEHDIAIGLRHTRQGKPAGAAHAQVTGRIERAAAIDGSTVQGDQPSAFHDGGVAGGDAGAAQSGIAARLRLAVQHQGALRLQIQRGCRLQGAASGKVATSLQADGLRAKRTGLHQVTARRGLQRGRCRHHALQIDAVLAGERQCAIHRSELASTGDAASGDGQILARNQLAAIVEGAGRCNGHRVTAVQATALQERACRQRKPAFPMQAAGVVQHAGDINAQIAQRAKRGIGHVFSAGGLHAEVAGCHHLRAIAQRAVGGQRYIAPGLGKAGQGQIACTAHAQIVGGIERATAVDGTAIQGDAGPALEDGGVSSRHGSTGQRGRSRSRGLPMHRECTLCLKIQHGGRRQGAIDGEIATSLHRHGLPIERAGLLEIATGSSTQCRCCRNDAIELHEALAGQRNIGTLAAQLTAAAQDGCVDLHRVLGDQRPAIVQRAGDADMHALAGRHAAALVQRRSGELHIATRLYAPGGAELASCGHGYIALARQHASGQIVQTLRLQRQVATGNDACGIADRSASGQTDIAAALHHAGQLQIAIATHLQIAAGVQRAAAVDCRRLYRDGTTALQHRVLARAQGAGAQGRVASCTALSGKRQCTLGLHVQRGRRLQRAGGAEVTPGRQDDRLCRRRSGLLQVSTSSGLQRGSRSRHPLQGHVTLARQAHLGGLAAKLPSAAQTARIDLQGAGSYDISGVDERPGNRRRQRIAGTETAALGHCVGSDLQGVARVQAARVVQRAGGGNTHIGVGREHRTLGIAQGARVYLQSASGDHVGTVVQRSAGPQRCVTCALYGATQRQVAVACDAQIAARVDHAVVIDRRATHLQHAGTAQLAALAQCAACREIQGARRLHDGIAGQPPAGGHAQRATRGLQGAGHTGIAAAAQAHACGIEGP